MQDAEIMQILRGRYSPELAILIFDYCRIQISAAYCTRWRPRKIYPRITFRHNTPYVQWSKNDNDYLCDNFVRNHLHHHNRCSYARE